MRVVVAMIVVVTSAFAQSKFPSKPVTIIVPYPAGGSNDIFARDVGKRLSEAWKQPVIVDNRPGAGGSIGAALVSKAPPDGYTICLLSSSFTTNAAIQANLPFDPVAGFTPIAMVAKGPMLLTVSNQLPVKSLGEFIALAKSQPGKLNYATSGMGSTNHFATELLMRAAGIQMTHVPYKGMPPAVADVIGGHADVLIASAPSVYQHVKAGKVRGLGVTSEGGSRRWYPTFRRSGNRASRDTASSSGGGILAPPRTPPEIAAMINAEVNRIIATQEIREVFLREGAEPAPMSMQQFAATIANEIEGWKKVAKEANIKAE
jgi:tripartite-type tricarboxylate transporter receptor subunit TctC